jgi:hypothetical protein
MYRRVRCLLAVLTLLIGSALATAGPLHDAANKGNLNQINQLIAEGADPA